MSSYGITIENLLKTLPESLHNDDNIVAIATVIAEKLIENYIYIDKIRMYPQINNLSEDLLDLLANDLKVDWYEYNDTINAKRAQIKDCISVHKKLGAQDAMDIALTNLYPGSITKPWYEYNGEPHHFKAYTKNPGITQENVDQFKTLLMSVCRNSAILDEIIIDLSTEPMNTYVGFWVRTGDFIRLNRARL